MSFIVTTVFPANVYVSVFSSSITFMYPSTRSAMYIGFIFVFGFAVIIGSIPLYVISISSVKPLLSLGPNVIVGLIIEMFSFFFLMNFCASNSAAIFPALYSVWKLYNWFVLSCIIGGLKRTCAVLVCTTFFIFVSSAALNVFSAEK